MHSAKYKVHTTPPKQMAKGDEESASQQQLISHAQLNWQWEMEKTTLTHPAGSKKKREIKYKV